MSDADLSPAALRQRVLWIRVLTIVGFIAAWEFAGRSGFFFDGVIPSTWTVASAFVTELMTAGFYKDLWLTLFASVVGFFFGSIIAVFMGILLGLQPFLRSVIEPFINAIGGTPKIIFLPIMFLIFGLGIESKIAKAGLSAFFPVVLSTASSFVQIPKIYLLTGRSFNLSPWQMISKLYLPAMADPVLTSLRFAMSMAIIGVLAAEISYSNGGLGYRLMRYSDQYQMGFVYADAILIFLVTALVNYLFTIGEDIGAMWKRSRAMLAGRQPKVATVSGA
ncbi:ABC transporter permease [Undibacter mobilis]|uniref:ABC transporter permease n=1 Tax=Undibacter mobilis TaxID=2292256 RepID=A0A371BAA4_9BRAD|nr:ABC transporter permease [Undibacter mobilis]RDV04539.1 ABC transporter permease [Undibacter mobilis]